MSAPNLALQRVLEETLAAHLFLRELGFRAEEISADTRNVANADPPGPWAAVTVRRDGKEFVLAIAALLDDAACSAYPASWAAMCRVPIPTDEALRIFRATKINTRKLLVGLAEAGLDVDERRWRPL